MLWDNRHLTYSSEAQCEGANWIPSDVARNGVESGGGVGEEDGKGGDDKVGLEVTFLVIALFNCVSSDENMNDVNSR